MTTATIPVDLFNPGQVFGCLGLMELSELLCGRTEAAFDWRDPAGARFHIGVEGEVDPIATALRFLADAEVRSIAPAGSGLDTTTSWRVPTDVVTHGAPYPGPPPTSSDKLPARLTARDQEVTVASWMEVRGTGLVETRRDAVKFWAGAKGKPGAAFLADSLALAAPQLVAQSADPWAISAPQKGSLRFDWRRDYIPIDAGFSLNEHTRIEPRGYPLVEALAVIGLSHARPCRCEKLRYQYGVAGVTPHDEGPAPLLPPPFVRAALGGARLPLPLRTFTMHLAWPGKEGQARCITTVTEESIR